VTGKLETRQYGSQTDSETEGEEMENVAFWTQILANLGTFLGAIALLWLASLYRDKNK
jgi:hypothetical protein